MTHKFDPENWRRLESSERRAVLPPEQILDQTGLQPGHVMVDVGAGTGYFAIPAAERVGPQGKVYAVDVAPQMLELLAEKIDGLDIPIELVRSDETDVPLHDGLADHVFTSTVLHEVPLEHRIAFLTELARLLKPDGRLTILDWAPVANQTMGPPSHLRLARTEVERLLRAVHLTILRSEPFGSDFYIVQATRG